MPYHTHLDQILKPILDDVGHYNWLLADLEYTSTFSDKIPVDMDQDYFILAPEEFAELLKADLQIWWGVILGIHPGVEVMVNENNLPFAEGNDQIWMNGNLQYPDAAIEIVCFDSSYTIVKFTDEQLSGKFYTYFPEAIELEKL
ncbi:hypothetical protein [Mucilaginibacter paludis]|nr:hypothetical protein [Mucilaginibacter paludis]